MGPKTSARLDELTANIGIEGARSQLGITVRRLTTHRYRVEFHERVKIDFLHLPLADAGLSAWYPAAWNGPEGYQRVLFSHGTNETRVSIRDQRAYARLKTMASRMLG